MGIEVAVLVLLDELVPPSFDLAWNSSKASPWEVARYTVSPEEWLSEQLSHMVMMWVWVVQTRDKRTRRQDALEDILVVHPV